VRFHSNLGRDGAIINGLRLESPSASGVLILMSTTSAVFTSTLGLGLRTLAILALENVIATSCYKKTWKKEEKQI
jgi:Na+-translocating ferredoxin:NAD+ oxidoreductase RnfE subunit